MTTDQNSTTALPLKRSLRPSLILTILITLLLIGASLWGLLNQEATYPTDELRQSLIPNDVVNLVVGVPILLISLWLTRRDKLSGLLFWPGALVYVIYNYAVYLVALPLSAMAAVYFALVCLSLYTLVQVLSSIEMHEVGRLLDGKVPARTTGGIVAAFGIIFILRVIVLVVSALVDQTAISKIDLGTMIADLVISPAMVVGGVQLWRNKALGYTTGLGLLFQASMLFIGLIFLMILQPMITEAAFVVTDIVVVAVMGLVCFVPFGLFLRGVRQIGKNNQL